MMDAEEKKAEESSQGLKKAAYIEIRWRNDDRGKLINGELRLRTSYGLRT